jgi:hypothetical protein
VCDNCPANANGGQADTDGDGIGNKCDPCPGVHNSQDSDGDGTPDCFDNCAAIANADQADADGDSIGDVCDNCPADANGGQADTDGDGIGNKCDNCPSTANPDQTDTNGDGQGDACSPTSRTAVRMDEPRPLAGALALDTAPLSVFPNPFSRQTTIRFKVFTPGAVQLEMFDLGGQRVWRPAAQNLNAGDYQTTWDGQSGNGRPLPAGIYLLRLRTSNELHVARVVLQRG